MTPFTHRHPHPQLILRATSVPIHPRQALSLNCPCTNFLNNSSRSRLFPCWCRSHTLITSGDTWPKVTATTVKTKYSMLIEVMGLQFHIWSIISLLAFLFYSSFKEEILTRSARTPARCSREQEDLRQLRCLETDRWTDRPYCIARRLLSACLSALPWGQIPNCWSRSDSVSFPNGVLFLVPSSNPCILLNKCLNSSSEHGPHPKPPSRL